MNFFTICILLTIVVNRAYSTVTYKVNTYEGGSNGGTRAEFSLSGETGDFKIDLVYDNKVKIEMGSGGKLASSSADEKTHQITGTANGNMVVQYVARYDNNSGANLMSAKYNGKAVTIPVVVTSEPITITPIGTKGNYNYGNAIHASFLFYEAQRSGKLPADNRIKWRGDSMLNDGKDVSHDLSGGYFDAGDLVKFNFPMSYTVTVLAWGVVDYEAAYTKAGELKNALAAIKWGTDYLIKCHTSDNEYYGQVGNGAADHAVWGRPEDWPKDKTRPSYKVTSAGGGSEIAGEAAAALSAASIAFKKSDATYSATLLKHAKSLYTFADKHRANYTKQITDAKAFYESWSGFGDELAWGAAWLLRATNDSTYKTDVDKHFTEFTTQLNGLPKQFSWDDKTPGVQVLLAKITGDEKYKTLIKNYCDWLVDKAPKSPKGMVVLDTWGPLRHAANAAFICLQAAEIGINAASYRKFAETQIGYILGDTGRSFVVGVGTNPPQSCHHRAASCPNPPIPCANAMGSPGPNPHILTGALVGGPDEKDAYTDKRDDYVHNEVACDYNAAFTGALAALLHLKSSGLL